VHWVRIEGAVYWTVFVATFLGLAIWESLQPKHKAEKTERRWSKHGLLLVICTILSVGLWRISPVVLAANVAGRRFGALNQTWIPFAVRCILAILVLDLIRYATHRVSHSINLLWRVHQVHHSDPEFDVSTGARVHPIEVIWTQGAYLAAVAILAPPVAAVLIAEVTAGFQSFFSHANASLPRGLERPLRLVFVTPDMHRVHHSVEVSEQFKNLGDIFPWWDRLFGTYLAVPQAGDDGLVTGLEGFQNDRSLGLGFMLTQPFRREPEQPASDIAPLSSV
jgi:sterol desaturase/sphingolipid hydroxylase (fatty acid hydroxylase superfamily)